MVQNQDFEDSSQWLHSIEAAAFFNRNIDWYLKELFKYFTEKPTF